MNLYDYKKIGLEHIQLYSPIFNDGFVVYIYYKIHQIKF